MGSYLVLLRVGFTMPRTVTSRAVRSYRTLSPLPALARLGGLLSAALSVGSRLPGVTWHSALWSPDFPPYHRSDTATVQPTPERKVSGVTARRQALIAQGRGSSGPCQYKWPQSRSHLRTGSSLTATRREHIPVGSLMPSLASNGRSQATPGAKTSLWVWRRILKPNSHPEINWPG